MPQQIVTESYEDFAQRHGGDPVAVAGRYLFTDGAMSNGHNHIEPPTDPRTLIMLQVEYLTSKLKQEEEEARQADQPRVEMDFEFAERQGCPQIHHAGRWLFENGAQWTEVGGIEPPEDQETLLALQCEFLTARLKEEKKSFTACQEYIGTQAEYHSMGAGPAPAEEAFTDLKRFHENVLNLREELQAKQTMLDGLRGPSAEERYNEKRNRERAAAQEAVQRATSIRI
jgi:hypothetical protein